MPKTDSAAGTIINYGTEPAASNNKNAKATTHNDSERVQRYVAEFSKWKSKLKQYWPQIKRNQELYEFYKAEHEQAQSNISLNTPFAIVESMVSKANEATVNITVKARGENELQQFERWVSAVLKDAIEDPQVAEYYGTFRKTREIFFREFLTKGNAVAAINWCYKAGSTEAKPLADNPYVKIVPLFSAIFNPTKTLSTSDVYYLESYVSYESLKSAEAKKGKGLYSNLDQLVQYARDKGKTIDSKENEDQFMTDERKVPRAVEPIHILERWEGAHLCVIADDKIVIREEEDPFKLGTHNIVTAMNYVIEGRPYAYGEVDAIYKPTKTQDTIINQSIDIVNRYLRPGFVVGSSLDPNQFIELIENGGVVPGNITTKPFYAISEGLPTPPAQAFTTIEVLQQAIERTSRFSPYSSGIPSSSTDKTKGTASGIQQLQTASEPNFQIKLDSLQDDFMGPLARKFLTMVANHMDDKDIRYGLLEGEDAGWVKASKNLLLGKANISDLVSMGILDQQTAASYTNSLQPTQDALGQQAQSIQPIPGADKAEIFDIDWIITVKLDNQSSAEKQNDYQRKLALIQLVQSLGGRFDPQQTAIMLGRDIDWSDIEKTMWPPIPYSMMNKPHIAVTFADLPPAAKVQQLANMGIQISLEDAMAAPIPTAPGRYPPAHSVEQYQPPAPQEQIPQEQPIPGVFPGTTPGFPQQPNPVPNMPPGPGQPNSGQQVHV